MPGILKSDASSCTNPLLPFFYQEEGLLKDIYALRFEICRIGSTTALVSVTVNMDTCELGGDKLSTGYYVGLLNPTVSSLDVGAYEIIWYYKVVSTSTEKLASYRFEVLDPRYFRISSRYESYVSSDVAQLAAYDLADRQRALMQASKEVDRLTGRLFFPKYMELLHTVRPSSKRIWLDQPIIGVGEIILESAGVVTGTLSTYELDNQAIRIYNRHLSGLLSPDDRDNPRIAFAAIGVPAASIEPAFFPSGVKNIRIKGAFGYTDPDGSPFGEVPQPLKDVVLYLAFRRLVDPLGIDPTLTSPGRIRSAKTRDQSISFDTSGYSSSSLTGDVRYDQILADYCRPPHVGVAG
jgi:hypothetical protein